MVHLRHITAIHVLLSQEKRKCGFVFPGKIICFPLSPQVKCVFVFPSMFGNVSASKKIFSVVVSKRFSVDVSASKQHRPTLGCFRK